MSVKHSTEENDNKLMCVLFFLGRFSLLCFDSSHTGLVTCQDSVAYLSLGFFFFFFNNCRREAAGACLTPVLLCQSSFTF